MASILKLDAVIASGENISAGCVKQVDDAAMPVEAAGTPCKGTAEFFADNVTCFPGNPGLVHVKLGGHKLGEERANALARYLDDLLNWQVGRQSASDVEHEGKMWANIDLSGCEVGDSAMIAILDVLHRRQVSIKRANIQNNSLTDRSLLQLALNVHQQSLYAEKIDASNNRLTSRSLIAMCMAIARNDEATKAQCRPSPDPCAFCAGGNVMSAPLDAISLLETQTTIVCLATDTDTFVADTEGANQRTPVVHLSALKGQRQDNEHLDAWELSEEICFWLNPAASSLEERVASRTACKQVVDLSEGISNSKWPVDGEAGTQSPASTACNETETGTNEAGGTSKDESTSTSDEADVNVDNANAARHLLSMLKKTSPAPGQSNRPYSEPQPLSLDEYQLWTMQAREDQEIGADVLNPETFGEDAQNGGWSFEENLAANERLEEARARMTQMPPEAGSREVPEYMKNMWASQSVAAEVEAASKVAAMQAAVCRAKTGLTELFHCLPLEPLSLKECLNQVVQAGWQEITWKRGYNALHLAAEHGCTDIVPVLVGLQADPNAPDSKGRTPLDMAKKNNHHDMAALLTQLQLCQTFDQVIHVATNRRASVEGSIGAVLMGTPAPWVRAGSIFPEGSAQRALHDLTQEFWRLRFALAEVLGNLQLDVACVKAILYSVTTGATAVESQGWYTTTLHLAAELGRDDVIPALFALGADAEALDSAGKTPAELARAKQHWGCAWQLTKCGRKPTGAEIALAQMVASTQPDEMGSFVSSHLVPGTVTAELPDQITTCL